MLQEIINYLVFGGLPAWIISLLVSALGIRKKIPWLLVAAGVFTILTTVDVSIAGFPLYLISSFQFIGSYYVYQGKPHMAWYLLIPLLLFSLYFIYLIIIPSTVWEYERPYDPLH